MIEEDSLAARVRALIGGDKVLRELQAVEVEELPDGLAFKIRRSNPGNLDVRITLGEYGWTIDISGSLLWYGPQKAQHVDDEELKSFIDIILWRLK